MNKYIIKIKKYIKMITKDKLDIPSIHEYRDKILMEFIKDIALNKLSIDDINFVSKEINNTIINNKINKDLWYA
jgi:hypothetical protein